MDVAGQAGLHPVVVGGEPRVGDVHVRHAPVHRVTAVVEVPADVLAVPLGQVRRVRAAGWPSRAQGGGEGQDVLVGLGLDPHPVVLAVPGGAPLRLTVRVRVAPALLRLIGPLAAGLVGTEHLKLLRRCQVDPHRPRLQFLVDGRHHGVHLVSPRQQQPAVPPQVGDRVHGRVGDQLRDLAQPEAEPPVHEHLPQPLHVARRIGPVPGGGPRRRPHEADLVVVVQRADGDAGQFRQPPHAQVIVHGTDYAASRHVRVNLQRETGSPPRGGGRGHAG